MRFFELCIFTTSAGIEVLTGVLGELGVTGFAVNDPLEFERFLNGEQTRWDYVEEALLELKGATPSITFY
ncbi:MAG: 50S ribosomal protein L11 methyltransferase, partial [Clostridia bacterium]|nr:50S ribosomal protein L11 methyltransferase [Clostridia bacterium]